jgi:transcriptional regulator with XRE-family HTH domain
MFSDNIEVLLNTYDITAETLARIAGVTGGSVTGWTRGSSPRQSAVQKMCDYFRLSEDDLLSKDYGLHAQQQNKLAYGERKPNLRELRLAAGYDTPEAFVAAYGRGLDVDLYKSHESGRRVLSTNQAWGYADFLNVTLDVLVAREREDTLKFSPKSEIQRLFDACADSDKDILLTTAQRLAEGRKDTPAWAALPVKA